MRDPLAGIDRFPRVRLGHAPTPLDPAPNLGAALGIELWIKRDDCTGLAFGGNKVRQLEFYLGEARARGADTVLTTGAVQSNFVRCAAAGARQLGMDMHIQLEDRVEPTDDVYYRSGNVLLDRLLGATLHAFPAGDDRQDADEKGADDALDRLAESLAAAGRKPYVIHIGTEHPPIGGLGYVVAAAEFLDQARAQGVRFDAVVCASGSGLTHAGTLAGMRMLGDRAPVHGICVRREAVQQRVRIAKRATEIAALIGSPKTFDAEDVDVCDTVLPPGYGQLSQAVGDAISMAARMEALLLDPVYTGKAMAGLIDLVRTGRIAAGSRVLFVHTGGLPAMFSYAAALEPWLAAAPATSG
jgi:D-cysteine desulfhydrase/L-cysteate sulfo-lyase